MNPPSAQPPAEQTLPPLRIHHFMLCMVACSFMFTLVQTQSANDAYRVTLEAGSLLHLLVGSICLTGLGLGLYWKYRGLPFFNEPGQIGLLIHGIAATYLAIASWLLAFSQQAWTSTPGVRIPQIVLGTGGFAVLIVQLVISLNAVRRFHDYGWWGTFYRCFAVILMLQFLASCILPMLFAFTLRTRSGNELQALGMIQMVVPLLFQTAILICSFFAMRTDLLEKTKYHWTHWLGAATWPAIWLSTVLATLSFYFFPPK